MVIIDHRSLNEGATMGETPAYCSDCYGKVAKEDSNIVAAESAGKTPMTKQGVCSKCGKSTVVVYYQI
jgi:hypothetical protein